MRPCNYNKKMVEYAPRILEVYMTKWGAFALGVVAGGAAVLLARDAGFKKACAKIIGAGLKLKDDAAAFVETVKEDAQDIMAEAAYNKDAASAAN